ncbi:K+ channel, inward rectifier [Hyphobacterium sp. CCMP332]|nr:K+ channel, inward rectifier [Hyphobacterium sp. CCMP332]
MDIKGIFNFSNDPGFGQKFSSKTKRVINKDGSFNVKRVPPKGKTRNYYHRLISMSWSRFLLLNLLIYILVNVFFALIYMLIGVEKISGLTRGSLIDDFANSFFFSVQTLTTVGYGVLSPTGFMAGMVASLEALSGLLLVALATGLLYGRFSKPSAKIIFSDNAIIAPYNDINALEFRIANLRSNTLIDMEASVMFTRNYKNEKGEWVRNYYTLELERDHIHFFPLTWTVVHPISESSPLFGLNRKQLLAQNAEILILIKGFDDTFAQQVHSRYSYLAGEVIWGRKYEKAFSANVQGDLVVELGKINDTIEADLNG